ncbi:GMP reductase [Salmonella enterica subsp. arizonae]|uniref:GMP reductase n=1 Tax=Salmonella enterica subsp. arizonae TaxID=59203 RepID=A0A379SZI1_SALER|nr:GMP reductase [Salmonella enterica subsp. arizonae]
MRIEEDLKLGFKDVLIRPKRSTLKSRSDVELERQFTFKTLRSDLVWRTDYRGKYGYRRDV